MKRRADRRDRSALGGGQERMVKIYTAPWTPTQIRNSVVGNEFTDGGTPMVITAVGEAYRVGNAKLFDTTAVEVTRKLRRFLSAEPKVDRA